MKDSINPTVITSRKAMRKLEEIKGHHADLLQGMQAQSEKVKLFNEQKKIEDQVRAQQKAEQDKAQREQDDKTAESHINNQKEMMMHHNKSQELSIKREALNAKTTDTK